MKLIHAQQTAKVEKAKPGQPRADVALGELVSELRGRDAEGDDEGQVEQQLQRSRGAVSPRAGLGPTSPADGVLV